MRTGNRQHRRLANCEVFAGCTANQIRAIDQLGTTIAVPAGTPVWHEDRTAPQFVVVVEGEVDLTRSGEHIATLGAGAWFGHEALLDHLPAERVSGVVTTSTILFACSKREFASLLRAVPSVTARLAPTPSITRTQITPTSRTRSARFPAAKNRERERAPGALVTNGATQ